MSRTAISGAGGRASGLSTIEALVVAALASTLAAAAAGHWGTVRARLAVRQAAAAFAADVQHSRGLAVARNDTVRLGFATAPQGSCWVVYSGNRGACACVPGASAACTGAGEVLAASQWPIQQPVRVESNVASMAFDPVLGTVTPAATVRFHAAGSPSVHQVVGILGRVRSCSPAPAMPGLPPC